MTLGDMTQKGGARLTRHYTDTQRDALLKAVLVDGMSQSEAERRAIAGTLVEGLAPFGRPRFIYSLIRRGRSDFEAQNDDALDSGHTGEMRRLYLLALAKSRKLDDKADIAEIARHAKAVGEAHKALRGAGQKTKPPTKPNKSDSASENTSETKAQSQADVLAQLSQLAEKRDTPPTTPNTQDSEDGVERGPVRSLAR